MECLNTMPLPPHLDHLLSGGGPVVARELPG